MINGNYALEADLSPAEDALALESGKNTLCANDLIVRADNEVRTFIEDTYEGAVLPAF